MTAWSDADLALLRDVEEVRIAPRREDGSAWPGRLVWVLVVDGRVLVRSWKGPDAEWYRRALATGRALLTTDDGALSAEVVLRAEAGLDATVDAEYLRKYPDPYATEMTRPPAAGTTLILEPA